MIILILLLTVHLMLLMLSFIGIIKLVLPSFEEYRKAFPTLNIIIITFVLVAIFYPIYYLNFNSINFITNPICSGTIIPTTIFFLIIASIIAISAMFDSKRKENNIDIPVLAKISFFGLCYACTFLLSMETTFYTNYAFDFSKKEERVVSVVSTHYSHSGKSDFYSMKISPEINGIDNIDISNSFYSKIKKDDKVKLYIGKGLYGVSYISSDMEKVSEK